ncbi:MAG: flagellar basal-body MS-ring/collar protein FliF [Desulfovermiculus sp.]
MAQDSPAQSQNQALSKPQSLWRRIRQWPLSRQLSLLAVALLCVAAFAYLILQARVVDYQLLYGDLTQKEASSVVTWLQDNNVPYELRNKGRAIYVPAGQVYKSRLDLAGAGLPKGQGVGFEVFDKQRFGVTKFTQEVNYQRALQGELARSVASLNAVKSARVHLVLPEKRVLQEMQEKPKASIVVDMDGGRLLSQEQISGIVHLVAGSVEGLEPDQVTLVTGGGKVLNGDEGRDKDSRLSSQKLDYKQQVEKTLEERASALMAHVFGANNAMVRVTANIDFVEENTTEEIYDPDSLVPRSEKSTEKIRGGQAAGGVPGAESNLDMDEAEGGSMPSQESSETINYEINRTVNRITKGMGDIQSLSVAVLLSEQFLSSDATGSDPQEVTSSVQRLVSGALGLRQERGDQIEVVSMPVSAAQASEGVSSAQTDPYWYIPLVKYGLIGLGILLVYFFLVRPLIKTLRSESSEPYKSVQELESEYNYELEERRKKDPTEQLKQEIARSEVTPAQIVKTWIKEK